MNAPSGTPSTEATATPPKMMAVASPALSGAASRAASPPAIAQTPPMQKPTSTRAARNHDMLGASALAAFAPASSASRPQSMARRSAPFAPTTTSGANSAARMAGTNSMKPPHAHRDVQRAAVIGTNSPTGSISVVTTQNVAMPTAVTASQNAARPRRAAVRAWRTEKKRRGSCREIPERPELGQLLEHSTVSSQLIK